MTKQYKIYLSGPSKNLEDEGKGWRQEAYSWFHDFWSTVDVYDPTAAYDYTYYPPETDKECRRLFVNHITNSDVVLVNLNETETSPGTAYEVAIANYLQKPIIGFGDKNVYGWIADSCDVILDDLKKAIEYIMLKYFYYAK